MNNHKVTEEIFSNKPVMVLNITVGQDWTSMHYVGFNSEEIRADYGGCLVAIFKIKYK